MDTLRTPKKPKPEEFPRGTRITVRMGGSPEGMRAAMERFEARVKAEGGLKVGEQLGATALIREERA
jgi:hypothetical protein